jgi:hypothetical protein
MSVSVHQMHFEEPHAEPDYARAPHYHLRAVPRSDDLLQAAEAAPFAHCSDLSCYQSECCSTLKSREELAGGLARYDRGERECQGLLVVTVDSDDR